MELSIHYSYVDHMSFTMSLTVIRLSFKFHVFDHHITVLARQNLWLFFHSIDRRMVLSDFNLVLHRHCVIQRKMLRMSFY